MGPCRTRSAWLPASPKHPLPGRLQGKPQATEGYKPLPTGCRAPVRLTPAPPGLESCTLLPGKTSILMKHQAPEIRHAECLKCFQNSCPSSTPALATLTHAVSHLLVFKWSQKHPCRPRELVIYGQRGLSLSWYLSAEQAAPRTKAIPGSRAHSCPPASSSAPPEQPLLGQPPPP